MNETLPKGPNGDRPKPSGQPTPKGLRVLFADDERHLRELIQMELPRMGHEVVVCANGREAVHILTEGSFDAAILDLKMPGLSGIQVLQQIRGVSPGTEVVILTGHASVDTAVEALRHGAFDYLTKPCRWAELEARLSKIAEKRQLTHRALALESRLRTAEGPSRLVGSSAPIQELHRLIQLVGPTESTVLILGETGTGKELVAKELHDSGQRAEMPFVPVNCGALPENLVESELFGHRKGAFTGANQQRKGLFEVADGGTLFLDEVGELPSTLQVKLLRFLESGEIRRVGENEPFRVDVRVVCATNRDLADAVSNDGFREDLYFRINTFEIQVPPLRERTGDLRELAEYFLSCRVGARTGQTPPLSDEAAVLLAAYHWPGNVRELANVIERAAILARSTAIAPEHLPGQIRYPRPANGPSSRSTLRDIETEHILDVLEKHRGHKPSAARELGISLKTLYNKLNQLKE